MALLLLRSRSYIQDRILKQGVGHSAECSVAAVDLHAADFQPSRRFRAREQVWWCLI